MTLIASDGYEYEDLTQRLLGNPLNNTRNGNIACYRENPLHTEVAVRAYIEGFDTICPEGCPGPSKKFGEAHESGLHAAYATGQFGTRHLARPNRTRVPAPISPPPVAVHPAH